MAAELTLVTPFLVLLLVLVAVLIHRGVDARLRLDAAAHQAARAASLQRTTPAATAAARATATAALTPGRVACRSVGVDVEAAGLVPGSTVTVTLNCRLDWRDAAILGVPGHPVLTATAREPIDTWRSPGPGGFGGAR